MKRLWSLCFSFGLLACHSPTTNTDSNPMPSPRNVIKPIRVVESKLPQSSIPPTISASSPKPTPSPVKSVSVVNITPNELDNVHISGLTPIPQDEIILEVVSEVDHLEKDKLSGRWRLKGEQKPTRIGDLDYVDGNLTYYNGALYGLGKVGQENCVKQYLLDQEEVKGTCFYSLSKAGVVFRRFVITKQGNFIALIGGSGDPEGGGNVFSLISFEENKYQRLFWSNPIGIAKILSGGLDGLCYGVCYPYGHTSRDTAWLDRETGFYLALNNSFQTPFLKIYEPTRNPELITLPENEDGKIPILKDGSADIMTLWRPHYLSVDHQNNFYIKDSVARETYIRKMNLEGQIVSLISAEGLTDYGYPQAKVNLKSLLKDKNASDSMYDFVIDKERDWLYILGENLYRYDLRTDELVLLAHQTDELKTLKDERLITFKVGSSGHLYTITESSNSGHATDSDAVFPPEPSKVFEILVPQPEGR